MKTIFITGAGAGLGKATAKALSKYSTAQQIADVIYEAATDNNNQLRYLAGPDAVALYKERLELGPEAHFQKTRQWVVGR